MGERSPARPATDRLQVRPRSAAFADVHDLALVRLIPVGRLAAMIDVLENP